MTAMKKPTMLMILDGYGVTSVPSKSAIANANTPNIDKLISSYPITTVAASGERVGLPVGQMGNSEVGHLNIGAGRVVYQDLTKISREISNSSILENSAINTALSHALTNDSTVHLMGLLSDGGVHSHIDHLYALINICIMKGISKISIHCFLDGRDVPPDSAIQYLADIEEYLEMICIGRVSSISGRYYAMDRDSRWDRVEIAYDMLTGSENEKIEREQNSLTAINNSYKKDILDEFVLPTVLNDADLVKDGDSVIMYNFRPDRAREITRAFVDKNFEGFERKKVVNDLCFVTMTDYDKTIENVLVAYPKDDIANTLGDWISKHNSSQLRIAETEKYAHVTFFLNGGREEKFTNEERILIPSPKVATYDKKPEMSAYEVTDAVIKEIEKNKYDLIVLNYANPDMVGHTGDMNATIAAIEAVDKCVGKVVSSILEHDGQVLLTSDHGNADVMTDENGDPVTAHSLNPVPLVNISKNPLNLMEGGALCDIAPTLLEMMSLPIPEEMTGKSLLKQKFGG